MTHTLKPGDVVLADALFDDYFITWELCNRGVDIVARAQYERVGTRIAQSSSLDAMKIDRISVWQLDLPLWKSR